MNDNISHDILERIQALLRMAEHPNSNPHEASLALEKAQSLLLQHNLTRASITTSEGPAASGNIGKLAVTAAEGFAWKATLLNTIAKANLCRAVSEPREHTAHLFGTRANVLAVLGMYEWLAQQLETMALRDFKAYKFQGGAENGRTWKAAFFAGATIAIYDRLQQPFANFAAGSGQELVLANAAQVKAAMWRVFPLIKTTHRSARSGDGVRAGRQAGANVSFRRAASLNSGQRALASGR